MTEHEQGANWQDRFLSGNPIDTRCSEHQAYEADYCPLCGTARTIGEPYHA